MIEFMSIQPPSGRPVFLAGLVTALTLLLPGVSTSVYAEAAVKGPIAAVQVDARDSSVAEILTALGAAFDFRYRTSSDLNRPVSGTFNGPLLKVVARVLKDYDYVVKRSAANRIEVIVLNFSGQGVDQAITVGGSTYPPGLFRPRPQFVPVPVQESDKIIPAGGSPYPPELFQPRPQFVPAPLQDSDKIIPAGGSPYPPELFQPRPQLVPAPLQDSDKIVPAGGSPYPPELFQPRPTTGKNPEAPSH